jgi:hypothetical protein
MPCTERRKSKRDMKRGTLFGLYKLKGGGGMESFNDNKKCMGLLHIFLLFGSSS